MGRPKRRERERERERERKKSSLRSTLTLFSLVFLARARARVCVCGEGEGVGLFRSRGCIELRKSTRTACFSFLLLLLAAPPRESRIPSWPGAELFSLAPSLPAHRRLGLCISPLSSSSYSYSSSSSSSLELLGISGAAQQQSLWPSLRPPTLSSLPAITQSCVRLPTSSPPARPPATHPLLSYRYRSRHLTRTPR